MTFDGILEGDAQAEEKKLRLVFREQDLAASILMLISTKDPDHLKDAKLQEEQLKRTAEGLKGATQVQIKDITYVKQQILHMMTATGDVSREKEIEEILRGLLEEETVNRDIEYFLNNNPEKNINKLAGLLRQLRSDVERELRSLQDPKLKQLAGLVK